jgi:hypothetical protein
MSPKRRILIKLGRWMMSKKACHLNISCSQTFRLNEECQFSIQQITEKACILHPTGQFSIGLHLKTLSHRAFKISVESITGRYRCDRWTDHPHSFVIFFIPSTAFFFHPPMRLNRHFIFHVEVIWVMTPCNVVGQKRFRGPCCLSLT